MKIKKIINCPKCGQFKFRLKRNLIKIFRICSNCLHESY